MKNTNKSGIAVAGNVLVDNINEIYAYPKSGELTQVHSVSRSLGGCVPNVSQDLKKICPDMSISAIGRIADDDNGAYVIKTLTDCGVDVSNIKYTQTEKTSFTQVISVTGGQRTFFTYAGAGNEFCTEDIDFENINPKILHLGYLLLLEKVDAGEGVQILKKALENGIETSVDMVSENTDRYALVLPCLPFTDYLIINEHEAGKLTGISPENENLRAIAEKLKGLGVRKKVIIHKPDCAVCLSDEGFTCLGSYILPEGFISGTTGAGDAFCAGALIGIYKGFCDADILSLASGAAVMALRCAGASEGLCTEEEIREFCAKFERRKICL